MATKKNKSKLKIVERKLGREKAMGICYFDQNLIELDEDLTSKQRLFTLVHELVHKSFESMSESEVARAEKIIGDGLWQDNYRRVQN